MLGQTNLKFEDGRAGEVPTGWFVLDAKTAGFTASWHREGCHQALPCAQLSAPANSEPDSFATLMQSFDASPFRGQPVRLRAWIRLEKKATADRAQMLLHVARPGLQPGFVDNMTNRPIVSENWAQYEIRGEVASDAETIQIGLTLHGAGSAWIGDVDFSPLTAETSGAAVDAARDAIGKQYARMDSAFMRKDVAVIAEVLMPGAQMGVGTIREPLLPAIQSEIAKGPKLATRTEISSVRLDGDEAIAIVRREAQDQSNAARSVVTSHRDTWVQTSNGWRWRESIEVSYHWVLPSTSADAARPVVAELKTRAVPVSGSDDLAAFGAAVGDARVVALGEAAHGTREFAQGKQRLVEYLVAHKGFTMLAAAKDAEVQGLADRLHMEFAVLDAVTADNVTRLPSLATAGKSCFGQTTPTHAIPNCAKSSAANCTPWDLRSTAGRCARWSVEKGESRGLVHRTPRRHRRKGRATLYWPRRGFRNSF